jgi:hypothetical protein
MTTSAQVRHQLIQALTLDLVGPTPHIPSIQRLSAGDRLPRSGRHRLAGAAGPPHRAGSRASAAAKEALLEMRDGTSIVAGLLQH